MKYAICCLFIVALLSGCVKKDKLVFHTIEIKEHACAECPEISISIPEALESTKVSNRINTALKEELITLMLSDEEHEVTSIKGAMNSFNSGSAEMKARYSDESANWEVNVNGEVVFENNSILTIALDSYVFTGGAHGYTSKRFLNFDKSKGTELENWQLFHSTKQFEEYAEAKFREQEEIPTNESINHTGLMFERDLFHLPENIGFTEEGLKLLYNPYEVASFADGPIELVLPHSEIEKYLSHNQHLGSL